MLRPALIALLLAAMALPAEAVEVRHLVGAYRVQETYPAGGVDAAVMPVATYGVSLRFPDLAAGWGAEAGFDLLDGYAFADRDLPASVHLRTDRRLSLGAYHAFGPGRFAVGLWGRHMQALNSFAPPADVWVFSNRQTYVAPWLAYRLSGDFGGALGWFVGARAMPAVACLLESGVTGPGWLYGAGGEAGFDWYTGAWSASASVRTFTLGGTTGPLWLEVGPTLSVNYRF